MILHSTFLAASSLPMWFREIVNGMTAPEKFLPLAMAVFVLMLVLYRMWTKPLMAGLLFVLFLVFYFGSTAMDSNFNSIVTKPDNVPITMMVIAVMCFVWLGFRRAAINDTRIAAGQPLSDEGHDDKVLVWPDLVYTELICLVLATAGLMVWSIISKAPLEQPANPGYAPNPAKAPWYFLGLQEMLVYFDPWMAGVVYPGLIIVGLIALPYIDTNPKGNGYYTLRQRPFAIATFMFGFLILWVLLIFFGTFLRGPNWNFYGPYEFWDVHKPVALNNINISDWFWIKLRNRALPNASDMPWTHSLPPMLGQFIVGMYREWLGVLMLGLYFFAIPVAMRFSVFRKMYASMGMARYVVMVMLLLFMALMPIKMVLRWLFNLKYFVYLPEFNSNF